MVAMTSICGVLVVLLCLLGTGKTHSVTVELFVTCDKACFDTLDARSDVSTPEDFIVDVVRNADQRLNHASVRLVLVGLEIWNVANLISYDTSVDYVTVQNLYGQNRVDHQLPIIWSDASMLLTGLSLTTTSGNDPRGIFGEGTICLGDDAVGVIKVGQDAVDSLAETLTHELGHGMGMAHDDGCSCVLGMGNCVMATNLNNVQVNNPKFSGCSVSELDAFEDASRAGCLYDQATTAFNANRPACGNGVIDAGEQCDCGGVSDGCELCCSMTTCILLAGAECARGACCDSCQYMASGTVCEASSPDSCDLDDTCAGDSTECVSKYTDNGTPCNSANEDGYCAYGSCLSLSAQCATLFNISFLASESCLGRSIVQPSSWGHCGSTTSGGITTYIPCTSGEADNYQCNVLSCEFPWGVDSTSIDLLREPSYNPIFLSIEGIKCWTAKMYAWESGTDPRTNIMVDDGTKCDVDKACYDGDCVADATAFASMAQDLSNPPAPGPICGNGIVEGSEECDCSPRQCECCDADTCTLITGDCPGNPCMGCAGAYCSPDPKQFDLCGPTADAGHCYDGDCISLMGNCKKYFGSTGSPAENSFYSSSADIAAANYQNNAGGYFIYDGAQYLQVWNLAVGDGKCGILQCRASTYTNIPPMTTYGNSYDNYVWYKLISQTCTYPGTPNPATFALLVDQGTPCTIGGNRGYCDLVQQTSANCYEEYLLATCEPII